MKLFIGAGVILLIALGAFMMVEPYVLNRASELDRQGNFAEEIALLREAERMVPWGSRIPERLDDALLRQAEQGLQSDRLDVAARGFREAWPRMKSRGKAQDSRVMSLAVTTFARGAERLRRQGHLSLAADFDDSLFVYAVRAPDPLHRAAALRAFTEGLNLRVQDGKPCAALSRLQWARSGLGGVIPGFDPSIEQELMERCLRAKRGR